MIFFWKKNPIIRLRLTTWNNVLSSPMTRNNPWRGKSIFEDESEDDEYVDGNRASTPETVSLLKLYKDLKHLSFPSKLLHSFHDLNYMSNQLNWSWFAW